MKVGLTILERIMLGNSLPREGSIITLKLIRGLKEKLSFSEEEMKVSKMTEMETGTRWDSDHDPMKQFDLGERTMGLIVDALKLLDQQKRLTEQHVSLYEKLVSGPEEKKRRAEEEEAKKVLEDELDE